MTSKESIFVKCHCCSTMLEVQRDDEFIDDGFLFTVWRLEGTRPMSIRERLRWCWCILKCGNPWADHTIVQPQDAQRIVEYLQKYLKNGKTEIS